jgi:GNAT superfamily N-acetyltransferase
MDVTAVLELYDARMRADPAPEIGLASQWAGPVLRRLGLRAFIEYWTFGADVAYAVAAAEAAYFRRARRPVEWRVFSHDGPDNLEAALAAAGFRPEPAETFLVLDLAADLDVGPPPAGVTVRVVTDVEGLEEVLAVRAEAFGGEHAALRGELEARLGDPSLALYVADVDGRPVASARLETPPGRPFAGLYGGGVRPAFRGVGLYRALVGARAQEARRRGARYLTVDAAETSRPILQRMGFQALATIRGWELTPGRPDLRSSEDAA